jgi:hypothetical protein
MLGKSRFPFCETFSVETQTGAWMSTHSILSISEILGLFPLILLHSGAGREIIMILKITTQFCSFLEEGQ